MARPLIYPSTASCEKKSIQETKQCSLINFDGSLSEILRASNKTAHLCHGFVHICANAACKRGTEKGNMRQILHLAHAEDTGSVAEQPEDILRGNTAALQSP